MRIGPKYKIARRLGAPIFEKTQTQKYALSLARKEKNRSRRRPRPQSEFGSQLLEKQKTRFTYGISERQFRNYARKALKAAEPMQVLFGHLESRLDNVIFRSGLAKTRAQARQAASHGHVMVNGRKVTIPSMTLKEGDVISLRPASAGSPLFAEAEERMSAMAPGSWIKTDPKKKESSVHGLPTYDPAEHVFDLGKVIEFYNR